jgi:hypothetical protein
MNYLIVFIDGESCQVDALDDGVINGLGETVLGIFKIEGGSFRTMGDEGWELVKEHYTDV